MSSPLDGNGVAAPELKDGQIYRWHWKEGEQIGALEPYWCKSRIAIVKDGKLLDTYWSGDRHSVDVSRVDLAFMGDQNWPQLRPGEELRYDRADICDMRHANSSHAPIYVRPGAKLNKAAMLVVLDQREADARSDRLASPSGASSRIAAARASRSSGVSAAPAAAPRTGV